MTGDRVEIDPEHGGRWTSLVLGGREWLWHRHDPVRQTVTPGAGFVDAGGLEECVPTVRGVPDHGDAWTRPWRSAGAGVHAVDCPDFRLQRSVHRRAATVHASYRLTAEPGYRFVWAGHALLDLSPSARLDLPAGLPVRLFPEAAPLLQSPWPDGADHITGTWPAPHGLNLTRLGPDDGTAVGAVVVGCRQVRVVDEPDVLTMTLSAGPELPVSLAIWRNLAGFPDADPYRSIGVEPMLGRVFDLATSHDDDDAVTVPATGELAWHLTLSASRT